MGISSCERTEPVSKKPETPPEIPAAPANPSLSAAQLALAKSHLAHREYAKALPYLHASGSPEADGLISDALTSARFRVPSALLRHPYPVLCFAEDPGNAIFAALGGKHPTVVRWALTETPEVTAVLFPTNASHISHISLSHDGLHLLVHRDATNLLCNATTLKPIANLGEFPANLDPENFQPFTANGLLLAHPTLADNGNYNWHIRDSTTGEILRSDSIPRFPKPLSARFDDMTLCIALEDGSEARIPILGQTETAISPRIKNPKSLAQTRAILTDSNTLALCLPVPPTDMENLRTNLVAAISGYELDPTTQTISESPLPNRLAILSEAFPDRFPPTLKLHSAEIPLSRRLAAAYPEEFPKIAAAQLAHAEIIRKTFAANDPAAISAVIASAEQGLPISTALFLSLESGNAALIQQAASRAVNMPPTLRRLIKSGTPPASGLHQLRLEEDWLGYESPDFSPIFGKAAERTSDALSRLALPENPTAGDIESLILRFLDPRSEAELGRPTLAESAIRHAITLAPDPELASHALKLSAIARRYGANPSLCLRTDATAFTSLGDFTSAHRTWIDLITNQPQADHLASDYAEAAYTAFENADAAQALEILRTGLFRFQNDVAFAIRAGWIALLTDHPDEALACLSAATKLGLPPGEIENTTALLAITHSHLGDPESAASYLAQLQAISPKWEDAQNIDALPWPDSFKATLKDLISPLPETEPAPIPESDPTHTAPRSGEFPIPEPPLPSR